MKEFTTTITQRGQVAVPSEVRQILGLKPRDKVTFTVDDGEVHLTSVPFSLESAFGSVKPSQMPDNFREISQDTKDEKAEKTAGELRKPLLFWRLTSS